MHEETLSDRESLVLAVFRYGLATNPEEAAAHLRSQIGEIVAICRRLDALGLLSPAREATAKGSRRASARQGGGRWARPERSPSGGTC